MHQDRFFCRHAGVEAYFPPYYRRLLKHVGTYFRNPDVVDSPLVAPVRDETGAKLKLPSSHDFCLRFSTIETSISVSSKKRSKIPQPIRHAAGRPPADQTIVGDPPDDTWFRYRRAHVNHAANHSISGNRICNRSVGTERRHGDFGALSGKPSKTTMARRSWR